MIESATAIEFVRQANNGRTKPLILSCETDSGEIVEVFCKFSAGCDVGVVNLANEVIAVCLAADLGLPVPRPFLVNIPESFSSVVNDSDAAERISNSAPIAFGSTRANQYSVWMNGNSISSAMQPMAAAILVFDGITQNPDRRIGNPNCLVKGDQIRIIDHELAFMHKLIVGWTPPWIPGGMNELESLANCHIFVRELTGKVIDFSPIADSWKSLTDSRFGEYVNTIPPEWGNAVPNVTEAVALIADARKHIDDCIIEVRRILT